MEAGFFRAGLFNQTFQNIEHERPPKKISPAVTSSHTRRQINESDFCIFTAPIKRSFVAKKRQTNASADFFRRWQVTQKKFRRHGNHFASHFSPLLAEKQVIFETSSCQWMTWVGFWSKVSSCYRHATPSLPHPPLPPRTWFSSKSNELNCSNFFQNDCKNHSTRKWAVSGFFID